MDFNRIGRLIKQTKDKLVIATDEDLLVVMDLDSYEELIRENQMKTKFVAKNEVNAIVETKERIQMPELDKDSIVTNFDTKDEESGDFVDTQKRATNILSVKDVIAAKAEQTFVPKVADVDRNNGDDEFYFEEVE
jgi:DNA mismatch repair ATPase MutL